VHDATAQSAISAATIFAAIRRRNGRARPRHCMAAILPPDRL
jgi:hypothetical protein